MRVLIQNIKTGEYLTQQGTWTLLPNEGQNFRFSSNAEAIIRKENISGLRVVFHFHGKNNSLTENPQKFT